jgi:elongation factor Ts
MQLVDGISNTLITSKVKTIEEALQTKIANGSTIDYACKEITGRIGEKIALRRFSILSKEKNQTFAHYQHSNKKIAVLLLFNGTINEQLGKDIAMHAAAMAPKFLNEKEVDQEWLNNEKKILTEQTIAEGKPAERAEMIVQGRVNKLLSEVTLVNQQFVKDQSKKINQLLKENNVDLLKYIRYEVGEGIEKQVVDFAAEVAEQMKK